MKTRLMRVEAGPERFAELVAAISALGLRCGWLDLESAAPPPPELEAAAELGVLRAVSAVGGRTVSVKPVRGAFVLRDLVREHFAGCALVLVRTTEAAGVTEASAAGEAVVAELSPTAEGSWRVRAADGEPRDLTSDQLARRLRKPNWRVGKKDGAPGG